MAPMIQIINFANAETSELNRWLAEQPCLLCGGSGKDWPGHIGPCHKCEGDGLTFPWASKKCLGSMVDNINTLGEPIRYHVDCSVVTYPPRSRGGNFDWPQDYIAQCGGGCNGSGRVPKAVRLEDLFRRGITSVTQDLKPETKEETYIAIFGWSLIKPPIGKGETPLLAALRAMVRSLQ